MSGSRALTLTDAFVPRRGVLADGLLVLGASLFIALSAQLAVPLPFTPVPVTGQTFAVLLAGALLGSRRGTLAVAAYLAEGASGLPVFAGGAGGAAHLLGPTAGYLFAFGPAAWIVGILCEHGFDRRVGTTAAAMAAGTAVILGGGVAWLATTVGPARALALGVTPFLPGAALKILLAAALLPSAWRLAGRSR